MGIEIMKKESMFKEMRNHVLILMNETEKLLVEIENLKKLNNLLLKELKICKKNVPKEQYDFLIDMTVKNEINFNEELHFYRKIFLYKGGFKHECFF